MYLNSRDVVTWIYREDTGVPKVGGLSKYIQVLEPGPLQTSFSFFPPSILGCKCICQGHRSEFHLVFRVNPPLGPSLWPQLDNQHARISGSLLWSCFACLNPHFLGFSCGICLNTSDSPKVRGYWAPCLLTPGTHKPAMARVALSFQLWPGKPVRTCCWMQNCFHCG